MALVLDSPDSGGAPAPARPRRRGGAGRARATSSCSASGAWAPGYDVDASASLAGAALAWRGRYAPTAEGDEARLFGSLKLEGGNVAPLASLLGLAPPGGCDRPGRSRRPTSPCAASSWTVSRISATVAGLKATGALVYAPPPESAPTLADARPSRAEEAVEGPAAARSRPPAALTGRAVLRPSAARRPRGAVARAAAAAAAPGRDLVGRPVRRAAADSARRRGAPARRNARPRRRARRRRASRPASASTAGGSISTTSR